MVQQVVGLKAQLQLDVLGDGGVFEDRKIELAEIRADQRVASFVSEMAGARNATAGSSVADASKITWRGERGNVEIPVGIALVVDDGRDHVGAPEKFTAAVEILGAEIIHAEGLAGLHCDNAVEAPA